MVKYIDAEKLIAEIDRRISIKENLTQRPEMSDMKESLYDIIEAYKSLKSFIISRQQEQPKDKQIVIITESHGNANIEWDCRSLDDVIVLLKSAESFITEKQIEKIAGPGCRPDYDTTEGRYSHLFKHQQEQPDVDLEKFTKKIDAWKARYNPSDNTLIKATMAFMARMFYQYPNVARRWYGQLPKATMD